MNLGAGLRIPSRPRRPRAAHHARMKVLILLLGPLGTAALVWTFGWLVLLLCFVLALATLVFSTSDAEAGESESIRHLLGAPISS
jgi:hypothetical protein